MSSLTYEYLGQYFLALQQAGRDGRCDRRGRVVSHGGPGPVRPERESRDHGKEKGADCHLDFAAACGGLRKIDYIGTAYVAGRRKGVIRETELDEEQEHNNTYEGSKLEAEKLVRESMEELPVTILRPSIVICDSRMGRASSFNGFYRALRLYWLGLMKMIPGYPSSLMDLVPVDYVTDAVFYISGNASSTGRCYCLTAGLDNATTLEEISDLAGHHLAGELRFDNSNTMRYTGFEVPGVRSYFGKMAEYIMKHGL